jgi:uncharacterized protein YfaS (alpha-2-macroglobulin family)
MQQVDLSARLAAGGHRLTISEPSGTGTGYLATLAYHLPGADRPVAGEPLAIRLQYDKTSLTVDDQVQATVTVTNRMAETAPMVILDLPIPAGFAVEAADLDTLLSAGKIAKYQVTPRSAIVYLRVLSPVEPLEMTYHLRATMPVKIVAQAARVYEYYNPDHRAATAPVAMQVTTK